MGLNTFLIFTIVIAFATSVCKIFEQVAGFGLNGEVPALKIIQNQVKLWFVIIYCIHYIFNDFIILSLNLVVDVMLVRVIRQDIRTKKNFSVNSSTSSQKKN